MNLFTAAENLPFGVALALMLGLAVLEVIGLALASSPSEWIDHYLVPEPQADGSLDRLLGWLHVGKVPALVLLVLFLAAFAIAGYTIQMIAGGVAGTYLPAPLASLPALATALFGVRTFGGALSRVVPHDESSSISENEFIGRIATITAASTKPDLASQARFKDSLGRDYFILAVADLPDLQLTDGMQVLIVKKAGPIYRVIENPHPTLI